MPTANAQHVATPTVRRRLIAMVYEAFLVLAVNMFAVALFLILTGHRHAPVYQHGLKFFLFLVTAAYFVHFWTDSGHTLAMKTWRIRLVMDGHQRIPFRVAALRYVLAWGWFLPALIVCSVFGLTSKVQVPVAIALGMLAWGLTAFLDKDRQFLHDKLAGTRLVSLPKVAKPGEALAKP
jgi:uncharacterized RDD family membrane protein YckC